MASDYEQLRLANIARNASLMQQLGLEPVKKHKSSGGANKRKSDAWEPRGSEDDDGDYEDARVPKQPKVKKDSTPIRRSSRAATGTPDSEGRVFREFVGEFQEIPLKKNKGGKKDLDGPLDLNDAKARGPVSTINPLSSKNHLANHLVLWPDFLGHQITMEGVPITQAKDSVMRRICEGGNPKFNKYSGIQEFRNLLVLFVNVGGNYKNVFYESGEKFSWFGQPSHSLFHPIIQRMVRLGQLGNGETLEPMEDSVSQNGHWIDGPILLFCRMPNEPYVFCGRLGYVSHTLEYGVVRFELRLLDITELKQRNTPPFQQILKIMESPSFIAPPGLDVAQYVADAAQQNQNPSLQNQLLDQYQFNSMNNQQQQQQQQQLHGSFQHDSFADTLADISQSQDFASLYSQTQSLSQSSMPFFAQQGFFSLEPLPQEQSQQHVQQHQPLQHHDMAYQPSDQAQHYNQQLQQDPPIQTAPASVSSLPPAKFQPPAPRQQQQQQQQRFQQQLAHPPHYQQQMQQPVIQQYQYQPFDFQFQHTPQQQHQEQQQQQQP